MRLWNSFLRRDVLTAALLALVAAVVATALALGVPWLGYLELSARHRWLRALPVAANPEIVMVEIRRDTPQKLGVPGVWPLPRQAHALFIEGLHSAKASVVLFDLLFLDSAAPAEDAALRAALQKGAPPKVVLATTEKENGAHPDESAPGGFRYEFEALSPSLGELPSHVVRASAKAFDPGGSLDGAILQQKDAATGEILPHIAFATALARFNIDPGSAQSDATGEVRAASLFWPVGADGELHARWTRRAGTFTTYEYADALQMLADPKERAVFTDKIVLIGDVSGSDVHRTPLGRISGLEFVAQVVNTLLIPANRLDVRWRIPANFLWTLLLAAGAVCGARSLRVSGLGVAALCLLLAALMPGAAQWAANWWIDTVGPVLGVFLGLFFTELREGTRAGSRLRRLAPAHWRLERDAMVSEQATILFVDVRGSTPLAEKLGPELWRDTMSELLGQMFDITLEYGADVDRTLGDGLMAVFRESATPKSSKLPRSHALRCARAVEKLLVAARQADERLKTKRPDAAIALTIGFESGKVSGTVVAGHDYEEWKTYGPTVNLAARLQSAAGTLGDGILCGPGAWVLLHEEIPLEFVEATSLKGIAEPVPVYTPKFEDS